MKHFCDLNCQRLLLCVARSVCPAVCRATPLWTSPQPRVCYTTLLSVLLAHLDSTSTVNLAGTQVPAAVSKQLCFPARVISVLTA